MHRRQLALLVRLRRHLAPDLHDGLEHLVVAVAREQDLARVQLVQGAADGPHVDGVVVRHPEHDLGRAVEPADEVRGDLVVRRRRILPVDGCAQIADLEGVAAFVDLYDLLARELWGGGRGRRSQRRTLGCHVRGYCQASSRRGRYYTSAGAPEQQRSGRRRPSWQ
jgi:hypothetical protein